jgi:hypothetical protein
MVITSPTMLVELCVIKPTGMKPFINSMWLLSLIFLGGCGKNGDDLVPPDTSKLIISNLVYTPSTVAIKKNPTNVIINGTFDFDNASGGVAYMKLTTSTGADLTVDIPANTQTKGTLSGSFFVTLPATPGTYTFQVWITDAKGNISNKLQGSITAMIDDTGTTWWVASQQWPLFKITWINNQFIATGDMGKLVTSPDGNSWTLQNTGVSSMLRGIAGSGSLYVVVGSNNTIISSPDGINWTPRFTAITGLDIASVVWSGAGFIAVGEDLTNNRSVTLSSPNGISWTILPFAVTGGRLNSIVYNGGQYVAVGKALGAPLLLTSSNGTDWTNRSSSVSGGIELNDITWTGSKYVAVGFSITTTSLDGINWLANTNISWGPGGVTWSGNRLMAAGIGGIYSSADGLTWIKTYDSPYMLRSITWSGFQYISVGFIAPVIMISPSG